MTTFLRTLLSQGLGIALGVAGGVALTHATLESRMERLLDEKLDAQLGHLRSLVQSHPGSAPVVMPTQDSREELRLIREQLTALALREPPAAAAPEAVEAPPEARPAITPEQEASSRQARQVLDEAISRGRWLEEDQRRFHQAMRAGTREQRDALESGLSMAINSGRLRPVFGDEGR
ncbi:hypothetical protein [Corallococcus llansteffanensis]|uniref:Uncharacterized protein n=1 Tax=Corallococcus llansteffanensis TaxID=2316731 RepID=A0A3A8PXT5_9BACT|nr:hypothetical protein [Corallococcus llansteffanensis]RKH57232.1 hypothetical protein D7V93_18780 [Corallococcus llansteffanensis]